MALYLVDYENTGVRGIAGIEDLKSIDRLIILYGPKTGSVPFEDMVKITSSPAAVEFVRTTKTAKNYLDFQLTTYLGYLVAHKVAEQYYIISKDSGFDSVVDFWQERQVNIQRFVNLAKEAVENAPAKKPAGRRSAKTAALDNAAAEKAKSPQEKPGKKSTAQAEETPAEQADVQRQGRKSGRRKGTADKKTDQPRQTQPSAKGPEKTVQNAKEQTADASQGSQGPQGKVPTVPEAVKKKVRNALKEEGLRPGGYRRIYTCMLESNDKAALNTALVHAFSQETGNRYYKQVLPAFSLFRGLS